MRQKQKISNGVNKLKFILPVLLLTILVLIGASCGGENGENGDVDLDRKLSDSTIKNILQKTAQDLGWTGYEIDGREGWWGLQIKSGSQMRKSLNIIEASWLPMLIAGSTKENFVKKACEQIENLYGSTSGGEPSERGGWETEIIKISGFDTCHITEYLKIWRDLEDCSEDDFVNIIIGNYLLQAMTHDMKEGRGVVCEMEDVMPAAEALVKNFLDALK